MAGRRPPGEGDNSAASSPGTAQPPAARQGWSVSPKVLGDPPVALAGSMPGWGGAEPMAAHGGLILGMHHSQGPSPVSPQPAERREGLRAHWGGCSLPCAPFLPSRCCGAEMRQRRHRESRRRLSGTGVAAGPPAWAGRSVWGDFGGAGRSQQHVVRQPASGSGSGTGLHSAPRVTAAALTQSLKLH